MDREPTTGGHPDTDGAPGIDRDDPAPSRREQLRTSLRNVALATLAVVVIGVLSGWLFARSSPQRASAISISALVQDTPVPEGVEPRATCGLADESISPEDLDAARAAGVVVITTPSATLDDEDLASLLGEHATLIVATAPVDGRAELSSHGRRMALDELNPASIEAYLTAYARPGVCG